jgi:HEAT repeat protein
MLRIENSELAGMLRDAMQTDGYCERRYALKALSRVHPVTSETVQCIAAALNDEEDKIQLAAAQYLGDLGENAREALPALSKTARLDSDQQCRQPAGATTNWQDFFADNAALAIRRIAPDHPNRIEQIVARLIHDLSHPAADKLGILRFLAQFGADASPALPALEKLLDDPDKFYRAEAATTAGLLRSVAAPLLPALEARFASENDRDVRESIRLAIQRIHGQEML